MTPPSEFRQRLRCLADHPLTFVRWLVFAAIIGLVAGGVSTAFYYAFTWATGLRAAHPALLWLLPRAAWPLCCFTVSAAWSGTGAPTLC